jgi:predicted DNA-binding transcriptional regulator AlpA
MDQEFVPWSAYVVNEPMASAGRRSLISAFGDLVRCQAGFQPYELPEIFTAPKDEGENDACRHLVELDVALLTMQFVRGKVGTFARPIGGGEAVPIPSAHWEIDDPLPRFATGTFNAADWANTRAPASHRIFVDTSNFEEWLAQLKPLGPLSNRELEEALNPQLRAARAVAARRVNEARGPEKSQVGPDASLSLSQSLTAGDELLTLHEVEAIVKFKRSSIYNKIKDDGFPESIPLGGKAVWRRSAVMAWVEEKLAQGRRSES